MPVVSDSILGNEMQRFLFLLVEKYDSDKISKGLFICKRVVPNGRVIHHSEPARR